VVFSKSYASSRWCLDELVEIVHLKNTIGHTLFPIFYHVNPSDVRNKLELLRKHLLGMMSYFRERGCKAGEQLLLKLQIVPVGILTALQMGIILWTLLLLHAIFNFPLSLFFLFFFLFFFF
jgi:hypothetical protein